MKQPLGTRKGEPFCIFSTISPFASGRDRPNGQKISIEYGSHCMFLSASLSDSYPSQKQDQYHLNHIAAHHEWAGVFSHEFQPTLTLQYADRAQS